MSVVVSTVCGSTFVVSYYHTVNLIFLGFHPHDNVPMLVGNTIQFLFAEFTS